MKLTDKVRATIDKYKMLSENNHVLIGLSGGPDSVSLTFILNSLKKEFNLSLSAVYIDHGLRPGETGDEKDFCMKLCDALNIQLYVKSVDVRDYAERRGMNLQEAARDLRYTKFDELLMETGAARIALGHNADDQAETLLMRLFRGSGRTGLSGIPPVRGKIVRPLIEIGKREIEEFIAGAVKELPRSFGRPYVEDSSNLKDDYFRNWLRNNFLNEIKKKNPSVIEDICRSMDIIREEDEYLEIIVTKTLMRLISRKSDSSIDLFVVPLQTIEKPVLRRILRRAVDATRSLRGIRFIHIEDIIHLIKNGSTGDRLNLPGGIRVIKDYSILKITTDKPVKISDYKLNVPGEVDLKEAGYIIKASLEDKGAVAGDGRFNVILDASGMNSSLLISARREGDCFYPIGFGKKKKLQDYFVDEKISRDKRDGIPIVRSGNDIIWIAGLRADDRYRITDRTEKILRLIMSKSDDKEQRRKF